MGGDEDLIAGPRPTPIMAAASALLPLACEGKVLAAEIFRITFFKRFTFAADPILNRACELRTLAIDRSLLGRRCTCSVVPSDARSQAPLRAL